MNLKCVPVSVFAGEKFVSVSSKLCSKTERCCTVAVEWFVVRRRLLLLLKFITLLLVCWLRLMCIN